MPLPAIILALIYATPLIIAYVTSFVVRRAMIYIANNWPAIKVAITNGLGMVAIDNIAQDTKIRGDAYFKQLKIVEDLRVKVEKIRKKYDSSIKTYASIQSTLNRATDARTINQLKTARSKAGKKMQDLGKQYTKEQKKLQDEIIKLDKLAIDLSKIASELLKKYRNIISSKKKRRGP